MFDEIAIRRPRLKRRVRDGRYVNVYLNGEDCRRLARLTTAVPSGAADQVQPSVAGG